MKLHIFSVILTLTGVIHHSHAQELYFPPINNFAPWDTVSPASMGWCTAEIDPLYDYLEEENTKAFIVLKDGKIALEKYFGSFTQDSIWYWASAGKTLTAFLVGKAQEDQFLDINDPSSSYLGAGWTDCEAEQENKIQIHHQLTMTTGLDDGVPDNHCTFDSCLLYLADAGLRWSYHNAPYTLLEQVLENATGQPINLYTQTALKNRTGMTGSWLTLGYDNVFFSKPRSMARFGLLIQNDCIWNGDTLLYDTSYIRQMIHTSQNLNQAYGYLWWLNGKASFMLPTLQFVFPGPLMTHAPEDVVSGLGKNGQIVSISKSLGLVVIRMGNSPDEGDVTVRLCDEIWEKLDAVICGATAVTTPSDSAKSLSVYPNPASTEINMATGNEESGETEILNTSGEVVIRSRGSGKIDVSGLASGLYVVRVIEGRSNYLLKFIKI